MKRRILIVFAGISLSVHSQPAKAQWIVSDPTAQAILNSDAVVLVGMAVTAASSYNTLIDTYNKTEQLLNYANGNRSNSATSSALDQDSMTLTVSVDPTAIDQIDGSNLNVLGSSVSATAQTILSTGAVAISAQDEDMTQSEQASISQIANNDGKIALAAALADTAYSDSLSRRTLLESLRQVLDGDTDQKTVQDLTARLLVENAHIANSAMQLHAIEMRQVASDKLEASREQQQLIAARSIK